MTTRIVGFDGGRNGGKTVADNQKWWFPTCLGSNRAFALEKQLGENDLKVVYKNKSYLVGEIAELEAYDGARNFTESKATPDTLIFTLIGIHRVVEDGDSVELVTCHPITNHKGNDKERIKTMLKGEHEITVNGETKHFNIASVSVTPEGACGIFAIENLPEIAHGLDIGSATINYATWYKGNWIDKLSGTIGYGFENSRLNIDDFARKVAMDFNRAIQKVQGTVFVSGGIAERIAPVLSSYITSHKVCSVDDPLYLNARACYNIGVRINAKKNLQEK